MNEQNDGTVVLDGSLGRLPILEAWANSSAVFWVRPDFPALGMVFMVGNADADGWAARIEMTNHPVRGLFRAYVPPATFAGRCETRYRIVEIDGEGARHVAGEGVLRVRTGAMPDVADTVTECFAEFPGGEVRRVTVAEDTTGTPVFSVGPVVAGAKGDGKPIYAFRRSTGFYYLVTAFVDAAGEPTLSVADEPSDGGDDSFVRDSSGFYRRIECDADGAGAMALRMGGLQT